MDFESAPSLNRTRPGCKQEDDKGGGNNTNPSGNPFVVRDGKYVLDRPVKLGGSVVYLYNEHNEYL